MCSKLQNFAGEVCELEDLRIGHLFKMISITLEARANNEIRSQGLTFGQMRVIMSLLERGGSETQRRLEEALGVSHATMTGLVQRLAQKGYVTSTIDEYDRRQRVVAVTEKGAQQRLCAKEHARKCDQKLTEGMTDDERRQLRDLLIRVYENVSADVDIKREKERQYDKTLFERGERV